MINFCEKNVSMAIIALFGLALAEIIYCSFTTAVPVHTGTCIGAIAGVIIPKE